MSKITKSINGDTLTIQFGDDGAVSVNLNDVLMMQATLAMHGLSQKVGDSYAANTGMKDAMAKAQSTIDALKAGQWNSGRTGGGGDLVEALMRATNKPRQACADLIATFDKDKAAAVRKSPQIVAALAAIRAERAAQKAASMPDTGSALDIDALFE